MLDLKRYFKAINILGITQQTMAESFDVATATINNWIQGKKEPRPSEEAIYIGTEKCRKAPVFKTENENRKVPITYNTDQFMSAIIENLNISEREKNYLFAEYGNLGYETTLRHIIHLAKSKVEFIPTLLSYDKISLIRPIVGVGQDHVLAVFRNGRVRSTGLNDEHQCNTFAWRDIVSVVGCWKGSIGLHANGTCVATGLNVIEDGNLFRWTDIAALAAGTFHVLGLKADGTVLSFGRNPFGQCDVSNWKNIKGIAAGDNHSVGLLNDGTVIASGKNDYGQCDVKDWKNVIQVAAAANHTIALLSDGTVVGCGNLYAICLDTLKGITAIATGELHIVGLKKNGCVVNIGADVSGLSDVERWHDIIAISAGYATTIGVRADGRVFVTHDKHKSYFLNTDSWKLFDNKEAELNQSIFELALLEYKKKLIEIQTQALQVSPYINQYHKNHKILDFSRFPAEYKKLKDLSASIFKMSETCVSMPTIYNIIEMYLSAFCDVNNTIEEKEGVPHITKHTYEPFKDLLFVINKLLPEIRMIEEGMSFPELINQQLSDFSLLRKKMPTIR